MIDCTFDGDIATLWLARGSARNALPTGGWRALADRVAALAASDARAVILASREAGVFSAGADIAEFADLQRDPARRAGFREQLSAAIEGVAVLPMPVIAAIDGGCFGAGVALMLACDIAIAGDGARFAVPPPGSASSTRPPMSPGWSRRSGGAMPPGCSMAAMRSTPMPRSRSG
ncbi:enoyl-CoA hydratase/isomerase family protein [Sphingomonas hankookensis]|uniref:enoyl-CoA hydratase/isomerase family protein n=1 Tax=Sphingomonas hankookensis TaxID=563996 RepID=UPI003D3023DA